MISNEKYIEEIELILAKLAEDPSFLVKLQMNHAGDCILARLYEDFEDAMDERFGISCIFSYDPPVVSIESGEFLVCSLFGLNSDHPDVIPGFIDYSSTRYNDDQFIPNALIVLDLLKGLK